MRPTNITSDTLVILNRLIIISQGRLAEKTIAAVRHPLWHVRARSSSCPLTRPSLAYLRHGRDGKNRKPDLGARRPRDILLSETLTRLTFLALTHLSPPPRLWPISIPNPSTNNQHQAPRRHHRAGMTVLSPILGMPTTDETTVRRASNPILKTPRVPRVPPRLTSLPSASTPSITNSPHRALHRRIPLILTLYHPSVPPPSILSPFILTLTLTHTSSLPSNTPLHTHNPGPPLPNPSQAQHLFPFLPPPSPSPPQLKKSPPSAAKSSQTS